MTGFGASHFDAANRRFRLQIKSVNHKGLHARFHLPGGLDHLEAVGRKYLRSRVSRGSVNIQMDVEAQDSETRGVSINLPGARVLMETLQKLASEINAPAPTLEMVLRHPGLVETRSVKPTADDLEDAFKTAMTHAVDALLKMRQQEGDAIATDMVGRLTHVSTLLERIEERAPDVLTLHEERLKQRLMQAAQRHGLEVDEGRVVTELVVFSDRCDVTEELVRARAHIVAMLEMITRAEPVEGKRLDFLMQEIFREFNTIGSKCRDSDMASFVVDGKVELEKIREQIQNVA